MIPTIQEFHKGESQIYLMDHRTISQMDPEKYLSEIELETYSSFRSEKRKNEFFATRYLRHQVVGFEHIHYAPNGAPYINKGIYISISHSKNHVGLAINDKFPIGLDLEWPQDKISTLCKKFMSNEELASCSEKDILQLTKHWSGKEALYKLAGRNGIIFKEELLLSQSSVDELWKGRIKQTYGWDLVDLNIFELNGLIISINITEITHDYP